MFLFLFLPIMWFSSFISLVMRFVPSQPFCLFHSYYHVCSKSSQKLFQYVGVFLTYNLSCCSMWPHFSVPPSHDFIVPSQPYYCSFQTIMFFLVIPKVCSNMLLSFVPISMLFVPFRTLVLFQCVTIYVPCSHIDCFNMILSLVPPNYVFFVP
jgi:hypothetical protein